MTFIKKGKTKIIPSEFDKNSFIGVIPVTTSRNIITEGFKWNMNPDRKWGLLENLSCNNKIIDDEIIIESDVDLIWTASRNKRFQH